jgi:hypothetical protein
MDTLPVSQVSQGKEIEVTATLPTITDENKIIPNDIFAKNFPELVANNQNFAVINAINMEIGKQERSTGQCV